jgi:hypothetical protein
MRATLFKCKATFVILLTTFLKLDAQEPELKVVRLKDTLNAGLDSIIFSKVEIEASFPGGDKAWTKYLEKKLDPDVPVRKKAPAGIYTVWVQFIVNKNGKISAITPLTNHGYGMEQEVVRILRVSPAWTPAIQDGKKVNAYRKQPITFVIEEARKNRL